MVLEGLFGKVHKVTSTKKLIDAKHLSAFQINAIVLKHPDSICFDLKNINYQEELEYLIGSEARNKFIVNLANSMNGNTLLLFRFVEKHGRILYDMIKKGARGDRKIFFVYGGTDADTREQIRYVVESERDAIIVASYGVYSVGVNIRNLSNIIFSSPSKSRIRNLQSIGRGLRKIKGKKVATLYYIADDLKFKEKNNYTLQHYNERIQIYREEKFPVSHFHVQLKQ